MLLVVECIRKSSAVLEKFKRRRATVEDFGGMNRGRGRGVYGGSGRRGSGGGQWVARGGTSSGSGGRSSSFQRDHDEPSGYSDIQSTSGGRGSSSYKKVEDFDKKLVNERLKKLGSERSRGNSYSQERSDKPVRSNEDHVEQSHQGRLVPESSCISSGSCVVSAVSTCDSGVKYPQLSDQAQPSVKDMDLNMIQISDNHIKGVESGADFMNERKKTVNVFQSATRQPSNPGFIAKPDGKEKHGSEILSSSHVSGNIFTEPPGETESYDICFAKAGGTVTLKPSLFERNREKRNELKRATEGKRGEILRPGLILLKNHLSIPEQAQIVNVCRKLGLGPGGFYQPGYNDGRKLHLKMMCLGKNWDPETSQYVDARPVDGAKPPPLPAEFTRWVKEAIQASHKFIKETDKNAKVEHILPSMSADLCIVNFYTESGKLGLHQDRDESEESLRKGLPVVSFSIGDSAEFLYSDQRDADKADKVLLESGDILIFGGKSRHIFHGVERILPNSAPKSLMAETRLRPGRLNLTFRQY